MTKQRKKNKSKSNKSQPIITEINQTENKNLIELQSYADTITSMYINDMNGVNISLQDLNNYLRNHISYNKQLRNISELMYNSKGVYRKAIDFMVNILPLDYIILCNEKEKAKYKDYQKKIERFVKDIKSRIIIRDILFKVLLYGTYFAYIRDYKTVQPLDLDYTKIIKITNTDFQLAFDMKYFDKFNITKNYDSEGNVITIQDALDGFPPEFKTGYLTYKKDSAKRWYPLDINNTVCVKAWCKLEDVWGRPLGLAAFDDLLYDNALINTDRTIYDRINRQLIHQKLGDMNKDSYRPTPTQQKQAHESVRTVLNDTTNKNGGIKLITTPFYSELKGIDVNTDVLQTKRNEESLNRMTADLGVSLAVLNGTGATFSGQTFNIEAIASQMFTIMEHVEEYLFNKQFDRLVPSRNFVFEMKFFRITNINRQDFIDNMKTQFEYGGSLSLYINSIGVPIDAFEQLIDEENEKKIKDKLEPPKSTFTQSGKDDVGAPKKKTKDKKDNSIKSDNADGNNQPNTK